MRQEYATFLGCLFQDRCIISTRQANILDSDQIEMRRASEQTAHNIAVEILVSGKSKHLYDLSARRAKSRSRTPCGLKRASFCRRMPSAWRWRSLKYCWIADWFCK